MLSFRPVDFADNRYLDFILRTVFRLSDMTTNSIIKRILSGTLFLLLFFPALSFGELSINKLETVWEDSIAVIRPEINNPFSNDAIQTLQSGLTVGIKVELQFIRTGYVKRFFFVVPVQYNVWTDKYRVVTPIGPLSVNDFETVLTLFKNDLIFVISENDLPHKGPWYVKIRAGERLALVDAEKSSVKRIEDELSGIAGWFFKKGKPKETFSDWSKLMQLPKHEKKR